MIYKYFIVLLFVFTLSACSLKLPGKSSPTPTPPLPTSVPTPIPDKTWQDNAGFIFQYSPDFTVDQDTTDTKNYANLTINRSGSDAQIKILAADTKLKSIAKWSKDGEEITIGGIEGMLVKDDGKQTIGVIDDGILFTIELTSADTPASTLFAKIQKSFEFFVPTPTESSSSSGSSDSSYSSDIIEEEIVEE